MIRVFAGKSLRRKRAAAASSFSRDFTGGRAVRREVGDVLHIEAVRGDQIRRPAEKVLRLRRGDLADRREAVRLAGRRRFHRAFGRDVVGARLPLGRDVFHRRIDVHAGAGEASCRASSRAS